MSVNNSTIEQSDKGLDQSTFALTVSSISLQ